ncbi:MAG: hypothetical protein J0M25_00685 [Flavobacteriales bacterium]|nr:hypothetical protein [Flavobacteriales bacterium]
MVQHIFLRQVLKEIEKTGPDKKPVLFEIEYRTFNSNNKSGGALKKYKGRLLVKPISKGKVFNPYEHEYRVFRARKNPNHWDNRTRNIELENGMIRTIKILYIIKFNGVPVAY